MNPLELRQWAIECATTVSDDPDEILAFAARFAEFVEDRPPERQRAKWGTSWNTERDALLYLQYPDAAFSTKDICRSINEIEGAHITIGLMRARAVVLGVRRPAGSAAAIRTAKMRAALTAKRMAQVLAS